LYNSSNLCIFARSEILAESLELSAYHKKLLTEIHANILTITITTTSSTNVKALFIFFITKNYFYKLSKSVNIKAQEEFILYHLHHTLKTSLKPFKTV